MPLIVLTILSVVAGAYTVQDANKRGMNGVGWGLSVLLTSAAGLPVYLLVRRRKARS